MSKSDVDVNETREEFDYELCIRQKSLPDDISSSSVSSNRCQSNTDRGFRARVAGKNQCLKFFNSPYCVESLSEYHSGLNKERHRI